VIRGLAPSHVRTDHGVSGRVVRRQNADRLDLIFIEKRWRDSLGGLQPMCCNSCAAISIPAHYQFVCVCVCVFVNVYVFLCVCEQVEALR
jgi:hypothetical protein